MACESSINDFLAHYEGMTEELYHKEFIVSLLLLWLLYWWVVQCTAASLWLLWGSSVHYC